MVASYQRRRLWGITEAAIDAFDALVAAVTSAGGDDEARQQQQPWWQRYDDGGDPVIHGTPFKRLRNRTGLARVVLDRRIELRLSQQTVADACRVVQGEVQAWEAGARIPADAELDALARTLDLDRRILAFAETGSAFTATI